MSDHKRGQDENRAPELSLNEFKVKMYDTLKKNGTVNSMKAQLRTQVLQRLKPQTKVGTPGGANYITPVMPGSQLPYYLKVLNSLVLDYLQSKGYHCTFSVFLPESGMQGLELATSDILEVRIAYF